MSKSDLHNPEPALLTILMSARGHCEVCLAPEFNFVNSFRSDVRPWLLVVISALFYNSEAPCFRRPMLFRVRSLRFVERSSHSFYFHLNLIEGLTRKIPFTSSLFLRSLVDSDEAKAHKIM